jgi:ComF family protein
MKLGWLTDVIALLYPRQCFACDKPLYRHEEFLCLGCFYNLPKTDFHLMHDNPVLNQFIGKININAAASYYYFSKGGKVQHLIHQLKYKGFKEVGKYVGMLYGKELIKSDHYKNIDYIIPIPLHPKKRVKRGYNQAEWLARGLSESMNIPIDSKSLLRVFDSETQTHKTRFNRWENVREIFALGDSDHLQNKHVLIVDDVITTGSTIEAAGHVLLQIKGIKLSVCSLACALH